MRKLTALCLLIFSSASYAATPGEVQTLIDQGRCSQALSIIQSEMNANPNKTSDVLSALMIEASLCDGRITAENKKYALKELTAIEKRNPMLIGLNAQDFKSLKQKIESIESEASSGSGGSMAFAILVMLLIGGGLSYLFFGRSRFEQKVEHFSNQKFSELEQEKSSLLEQASDLLSIVQNKSEKARFSGDEKTLSLMLNFEASILNIIQKAKSQLRESDIKAAMNRLSNIKTLIKSRH